MNEAMKMYEMQLSHYFEIKQNENCINEYKCDECVTLGQNKGVTAAPI